MEPPREELLTLLQYPSHILTENEIALLWKYLCPSVRDMQTVRGRSVDILRQGNVARHSGPDVSDVKLRLDGVVRSGDVEIHRQTSDWYHHGHHRAGPFNRVVLHLVLTGQRTSVRREDGHWVDTLVLGDYLDELKTLLEAVSDSEVSSRRSQMKRPCFRNEPGEDQFRTELGEIAGIWLAGRSSRFRNGGSVRLLTDLIGALGYARNHESFLKLGRRLTFDRFEETLLEAETTDQVEGYLLGIGGWFNGHDGSMNSAMYSRRRSWKDDFRSATLGIDANITWKKGGVRPHARPLRRWVLFGWATRRLLHSGTCWYDWIRNRFRDILDQPDSLKRLQRELRGIFKFPKGNYWRYHYSMEDDHRDSVPLPLGPSWFNQVTMNLLLPYMYYRGISAGDTKLRKAVKSVLHGFPPRMNNRRTRRIQRQWGFEEENYDWDNGFHQQGAIYLYQEGCRKSRCNRCPLNTSDQPDQADLFTEKR